MLFAALQAQLVGGQGLGGGRVKHSTGQDAGTDLLDLHGQHRGRISSRVPRRDNTERLGQGILARTVGVEPQRGTLGRLQPGGIGVGVQGKAARIGQHRVIQQSVQIILLGRQVAVLKVAFEGYQHKSAAAFTAAVRQQVGQLGAAEHCIFGAVGHVVPLQRDGAVDAVERACQRVCRAAAISSQQRGRVAGRPVRRGRKDAGSRHAVGACIGQGVVAAAQRDGCSLRLVQPYGERLHKVTPLLPVCALQRCEGTVTQQRVQHRAVGPVAVQAAPKRQGAGIPGNVRPGGGRCQQRVACDIQQAAAGSMVSQQQIRRGGIRSHRQRHALRLGIGTGRRGQCVRGIHRQRLGGGGGCRLDRSGIFNRQHGRFYISQRAARQQQRRKHQRRRFHNTHRMVFLISSCKNSVYPLL